MGIVTVIQSAVSAELKHLYQIEIKSSEVIVSETKPEFEGDYTVVFFGLVKILKKSPEQIGTELGKNLVLNNPQLFPAYNVIKGFLNLTLGDSYWLSFLQEHFSSENFGFRTEKTRKVMIEYSSPNTNKPLHLGHLRNNFLGYSVSEILKANG